MKENIEKPITMVIHEFIEKITDDVNNCNLPLFVVEPILKDVYLEVKLLLQKQYEAEVAEYKRKIKQDL